MIIRQFQKIKKNKIVLVQNGTVQDQPEQHPLYPYSQNKNISILAPSSPLTNHPHPNNYFNDNQQQNNSNQDKSIIYKGQFKQQSLTIGSKGNAENKNKKQILNLFNSSYNYGNYKSARSQKETKYMTINPQQKKITKNLRISSNTIKFQSQKLQENKQFQISKKLIKQTTINNKKQQKQYQKSYNSFNSYSLNEKDIKQQTRSRFQKTLDKFKTLTISKQEGYNKRYSLSQQKSIKPLFDKIQIKDSTPLQQKQAHDMILKLYQNKINQSRAGKIKRKIIIDDKQEKISIKVQKSIAATGVTINDPDQEIAPNQKSYHYRQQKTKLSLQTSVKQLQQICLIQKLKQNSIQIMIPKILKENKIEGCQTHKQLKIKAHQILEQLTLDITKLVIKRYSNCVIFTSNNTAIAFYFTGKIYYGGWKNDQKQGLGMQFVPNKHWFFGLYQNNRKNGLGISRQQKGNMISGVWLNNVYSGKYELQTN